jgi:hypothetical protein
MAPPVTTARSAWCAARRLGAPPDPDGRARAASLSRRRPALQLVGLGACWYEAAMISSTSLGWMLVATLAWGCGGATSEEAAPAPTTPATASGASTSTSGGEPQGAEADEVTYPMATSEFLGMVTFEATPEVCGDGSPFRRCYPSLDGEQCANVFGRAMLACGEAMQGTLPQTVDDEATADSVAHATASCAGQAFTQGLDQAGVPRSAECQQQPAQ